MKKLMMLAALLAMVLVAAAPALAQDASTGDTTTTTTENNNTVEQGDQSVAAINDCEQTLNQYNNQEANISGDINNTGEGDASNNIAQGGISAEQAQYCVNLLSNVAADNGSENNIGSTSIDAEEVETDGVDNDEDGAVDEGDGSEASAAAAAAAAASSGGGSAAAGAGASSGGSGSSAGAGAGASSGGSGSSAGQLPATGGVSLLTLGAGALLVGGGLVARRIVR